MTKIVNIDEAVVDTEKFRGYNSEAQQILQSIAEKQEEYKILVKTVADETKIKKGEVSGYFKARHNAKVKETVKKGALYEALSEALENSTTN